MTTTTLKRRRKRKVTVKPGFLPGELTRMLRAIRAAGISVGQVEIANGVDHNHIDHRITVTTNPEKEPHAASGYLSMREACAYGKFGRSIAYKLIAAGKLHSKKLGTKTLVSKASIDRFLKRLPHKH